MPGALRRMFHLFLFWAASRQLSILFLVGHCTILVGVCGGKRGLVFLPLHVIVHPQTTLFD